MDQPEGAELKRLLKKLEKPGLSHVSRVNQVGQFSGARVHRFQARLATLGPGFKERCPLDRLFHAITSC